MSQWHNQISNAILAMRSSLSSHLPGYIVQNNTIQEAEESRHPAHPTWAHAIPSYVNPHYRERGVNGAEMASQLSPLSLASQPCALDASFQQPCWGSGSGPCWHSSMVLSLRQLWETGLAAGKWHQPPGISKAKVRGMSVPEVPPRRKVST